MYLTNQFDWNIGMWSVIKALELGADFVIHPDYYQSAFSCNKPTFRMTRCTLVPLSYIQGVFEVEAFLVTRGIVQFLPFCDDVII
jgi:hypothetical protein